MAEYVKLGGRGWTSRARTRVIIDRISHEVPFYRTYLKHAVLQGATVINNPFMWTADDKFFGAALATTLGVAHPKTMVLPNKDYVPGIVHDESLRNLEYPLDWDGDRRVRRAARASSRTRTAAAGATCTSASTLEELIRDYDESGLLTMIVQEFIEWDQYVRCMCLGQEDVLPMKYDPRERQYIVEHEHLTPGAAATASSTTR